MQLSTSYWGLHSIRSFVSRISMASRIHCEMVTSFLLVSSISWLYVSSDKVRPTCLVKCLFLIRVSVLDFIWTISNL